MAAHGDGELDDPKRVTLLLRVFYAACGVVLLSEFLIHKHGEHPLEETPFFHGWYGFLAIVVLVLVSVGLRKVVLRPEDYYGDTEVDPAADDAGEEARHG